MWEPYPQLFEDACPGRWFGAEPAGLRVDGTPAPSYWWMADVHEDGRVTLWKAMNVPFCALYGWPGELRREKENGHCDSVLSFGADGGSIEDIVKRLADLQAVMQFDGEDE